MKNKDLKTDPFDLSDDLNFDDFDMSDGEFSAESKKTSRSPVENVFKGTISGAIDHAKSPTFINSVLKDSLPPSYGKISDAATKTADEAQELYDDFKKELRPGASQLLKNISRMIPDSLPKLKGYIDKAHEKISDGDDRYRSSYRDEDIREKSIEHTLSSIFEAQNKIDVENEESRKKDLKVDRALDNLKFKSNLGVLNSIDTNISTLTQYNDKVNKAYQKKSLELQLRSLMVQTDLLSISKKYFEVFQRQNESITKNTALPEFVKIRETERFREEGKKQLYGGILDKLRSSEPIERALSKIKGDARSLIGGAKAALEFGNTFAETQRQDAELNRQIDEMDGREYSPAYHFAKDNVSSLMDWIKDLATPHIEDGLSKVPGLHRNLNRVGTIIANPSAGLKTVRDTDTYKRVMHDYDNKEYGKRAFFKTIDYLSNAFSETDVGGNLGLDTSKTHTGSLEVDIQDTKKANISLIEIIPGLLSRIHNEISIWRTGQDDGGIRYDYSTGKFTTRKQLSKKLASEYSDLLQRGSSGYSSQRATRELLGYKHDLDKTEEASVSKFFMDLSREKNVGATADDYLKSEAFKNIRNEKFKAKLEDILRAKLDDTEDPDYQKRYDLAEAVLGIKKSGYMDRERIDKGILADRNAGHGDILEELGLLEQTDRGDIINREAIHRYQKLSIDPQNKGRHKLRSKYNYDTTGEGTGSTIVVNHPKLFQSDRGSKDISPAIERLIHAQEKFMEKDCCDFTETNSLLAQIRENTANTFIKTREVAETLLKGVMYREGGGSGGDRDPNRTAWGEVRDDIGDFATSKAKIVGNTIKSAFNLANKFIVKPTKDFVFSDNNKKRATEGMGKLMSGAFDLGAKALKTTYGFLTDGLPKGLGKVTDFIKDKAKIVTDAIGAQINKVRDLYIPGSAEPIIRAAILKMGGYIDEATGLPIYTMDDLLKAKGNIVDKAGNLVLSTQEKAQGLVDRYGEKVVSSGNMLIKAGIGFVANKGRQLLKAGTDLASSLFKGTGKAYDSVKEATKTFFDNMTLGFGKDNRVYHVLVEIRDILLNKTPTPHEDIVDPITGNLKMSTDKIRRMFESGRGTGKLKAALDAFRNVVTGNSPETSPSGTEDKDPSTPNTSAPYQGGDLTGGLISSGISALTNNKYVNKGKDWLAKKFPKQFGNQRPDFMGPQLPGNMTAKRSMWDKAKGKLAGGRFGGLISTGMGMLSGGLSGLGSMAGGLLGGDTKRVESETTSEADLARKDMNKKPNVWKQTDPSKATWNDRDGSGRREGDWRDRLEEKAALQASRNKEKKKADLTAKYKSDQNVVDKMLNMTKGMFSGVLGGITGMLGTAADFMGLKNLGGIVKNIVTKIPGMSKIGGALSKVKTAASVARFAPMIATAATASGGAAAASAAGAGAATTATVAAGTGIMAKIGLAISLPFMAKAALVAGTAYGIYKLYKFATRNNLDEYEELRIRQYGFAHNDIATKYNHRFLALEQYLEDGKITFTGRQASILGNKVDVKELFEILGVDVQDKDKVNDLTTWYNKRFKPIYLTHRSVLKSVSEKSKLEDIKDLTLSERVEYLSKVGMENGPYDIPNSPLTEVDEASIDKDAILEYHKVILQNHMEKLKKTSKATGIPRIDPKTQAPGTAQKSIVDSKAETGYADMRRETRRDAQRAKATTQAQNAVEGQAEDGKDTGKGGGSSISRANKPPTVSGLITAAGPIASGEAGAQFIKADRGVNINNLNPAVQKNLLAMAEEYGTLTGKSLFINSAWRDTAKQAELYRTNPNAARPGRSLHEFGLAFDMNQPQLKELEDMGLMRKYGFTRPVGGEPWHVEPAGIQEDLNMARSDPGIASGMVANSLGKGGGGTGIDKRYRKYQRDRNYALALWGVSDKTIDNTMLASNDSPANIQNTSTYSGPVVRSTTQSSIQAGQENSKTLSSPGGGNIQTANMERPQSQEQLKEMLNRVGQETGVGGEVLQTFAALESSFNPNARAGTSNAQGLFQFMPATWDEQLAKHGSKYGLDPSATPMDPVASAYLAAEYIKQNDSGFIKAGHKPSTTDSYFGHFLGAGGRNRLYSADPNAIAAEVSPSQAKANKPTFYDGNRPRTVNEVKDFVDKKVRRIQSEFNITSGGYASSVGSVAEQNIANPTPSNLPKESNKPTQVAQAKPSERTVPSSMFTPPQASTMGGGSTGKQAVNQIDVSVDTEVIEQTLEKSYVVQTEIRDYLKKLVDVTSSNVNVSSNTPTERPGRPGQSAPRPSMREFTPSTDMKRKVS